MNQKHSILWVLDVLRWGIIYKVFQLTELSPNATNIILWQLLDHRSLKKKKKEKREG